MAHTIPHKAPEYMGACMLLHRYLVLVCMRVVMVLTKPPPKEVVWPGYT